MLEPLQAVEIVYSITKVIYAQVQLVKANKAQFRRLAGRIHIIEDTLRGLDQIPDSDQFRSSLCAFKDCLDSCLTFVQQFTDKNWFKKVLLAGTYKDKFNELNTKLKQLMSDLNLGLNVQQVMNREQDREDQKSDYQDICQKQDEIIKLNQEELVHIQRLERQQQEQQQILLKQLQSMQFQIQLLNVSTPKEKPPIDPNFVISYFEIMFDKEIGKGSFGIIYLARWCEQQMAMRTLEGSFTKEEELRFIREVNIMSRLRSPNIVQFYGACLEKGRACLAMEYMEQGSLYDVLDRTVLVPEQQQTITLDIARGLHYLHTKGVLHRDLKSKNVLIDRNWQAKLTDFGLSKTQYASIMTIKEQGKSQAIQWHAPETFSIRPTYTEQSDIYSYGVILLEIVTGRHPYTGITEEREIIEKTTKGEREAIPDTVHRIYVGIIQACWSLDSRQRPSLVDTIRTIESHEIRPPTPSAETLYEQGLAKEKEKDYQEAFKLYQRASSKEGHSKALTHLGLFHLRGLAVQQDKQQAKQCFERAADKGHIGAQYNLATMLEHGDGIPKDQERALFWYGKAAEQGDSKARQKSMSLSKRMTVQ